MRKVVIIDGTHLKGKYSGRLLTASAQDGNFQIFPIGFGIVDSENDQSWTWFFSKLQTVVPDSYDLVLVSDRHLLGDTQGKSSTSRFFIIRKC